MSLLIALVRTDVFRCKCWLVETSRPGTRLFLPVVMKLKNEKNRFACRTDSEVRFNMRILLIIGVIEYKIGRNDWIYYFLHT